MKRIAASVVLRTKPAQGGWQRCEALPAVLVALALVPSGLRCGTLPSSSVATSELQESSRHGQVAAVEGIIRDEFGAPIANAVVRLYELRDEPFLLEWDAVTAPEKRTDTKGHFAFESIPIGFLGMVVARAPERAFAAAPVVTSRRVERVVLEALPATVLVAKLSECSWPSIAVDAGTLLMIESVGEDCSATFSTLAPGKVIVHPVDGDRKPVGSGHVVALRPGSRVVQAIEVRKNVVGGRVSLKGEPLPDTVVELYPGPSTRTSGSIHTRTDAMGQFYFYDLHPGDWEVYVEARGVSVSRWVSIDEDGNREIELIIGAD